MDWTLGDFYHLSAITGVFIALIALIYAYRQVRFASKQMESINKQMNVNTLFKIYEEMKNLHPDISKLYQIYLLENDCTKWTPEQNKVANKICVTLERIAFLSEKGFISESLLLEEYAGVFARTWDCLDLYVKMDRKRRGNPLDLKNGARLRKHYEIVALKAQAFYNELQISYKTNETISKTTIPSNDKA